MEGATSAAATLFVAALPWLVLAILLLAFSLADDLPHAGVRTAFLGTTVGLIAISAALAWLAPGVADGSTVFVAATPLLFLFTHHVLRLTFRQQKGEEPNLRTGGTSASGTHRLFFEKNGPRRLSGLDYVYSLLLGLAMLITATPALGRILG